MKNVPVWVIQSVVGILLASLVSWASWTTATTMKHETALATTKTDVDNVKGDISEIKDGMKEIREGSRDMNKKLDRLIERRH